MGVWHITRTTTRQSWEELSIEAKAAVGVAGGAATGVAFCTAHDRFSPLIPAKALKTTNLSFRAFACLLTPINLAVIIAAIEKGSQDCLVVIQSFVPSSFPQVLFL